MRALIERLKDSAQADTNMLGEMLEEALADGRFHAALRGRHGLRGEAVADTFAVTRLCPARPVTPPSRQLKSVVIGRWSVVSY